MREPEYYQREGDGLWDWRLWSDNHRIIATSGGQGYTERNDAKEGFERVVLALQLEDGDEIEMTEVDHGADVMVAPDDAEDALDAHLESQYEDNEGGMTHDSE